MTFLKNIINRTRTYLRVWKVIAENELQQAFVNRYTNLLFVVGKMFRLGMTLLFLFILKQNISIFAGYTIDQVMVFFLTYQLIDVISQVIYRGVYNFGEKVRTGSFDFYLTKPLNILFQSLVGKPDYNDALFLIPIVALTVYLFATLNLEITWLSSFWYIVMLFNSFLISTALHIIVITVGIFTTEVDGIIWMYRDVSRLGQVPVTIYQTVLRNILFFFVPIGMMTSIPAQVLINSQPSYSLLTATGVGVAFFLSSVMAWNWGLKYYSSASS